MFNIVVFITALSQGLVGLFVYLKKRKSISNISFALLSFSTLSWAVTNYVYTLNPSSPSTLVTIRFILFFVVIQNTFFYIFAKNYPSNKQIISKRKLSYFLGFSGITALATVSPYVFLSVTVSDKQATPNPGPLIALFMLHAVYTIYKGIAALVRKQRHSSGIQKKQLQYILFAAVLNFALVPVTNFVLTLALRTTVFAKVSPFYTLAFAGIFAYAIITQKLFDIRAALARSVAYVLIIGLMALTYSVIIFGIVNLLFAGAHRETLRQILSVVLVFPLALSFQSIKNFFDRLTNRIFYKDNYDPQVVLGRLGRAVAAEVDLDKVLEATRRNLKGAIKSSFIEFVFFKDGNSWLAESTLADPAHRILAAHSNELTLLIKDQTRTILMVDEGGVQHSLRQVLEEAGVAISMRLKTQDQTVGYVLFGEKMNGDVYSAQDVKMLRIVANELAIATQNALRFEQIEQFNLTLQQKVDNATRQLRDSNARLKKLDETKDDFISMASHQLRTPLTSVKGYVSMVLDGDAGKINKQQQQLLNQAFVSSQRMVALIADLLNVSRLRTGKFMIDSKPTNLAELVEGEISQLKETAKSRGLTLTFERPHKFPDLMLDETKIRQVVMNFTDNAIYYTPSGGKINVQLEDKPSSIEFKVIDNGIGVPASERHHLFTKFYRAGNARKARPDGTGLGLFMAKKVIIAQGGALIFISKEAEGSTFGFSFPKVKLVVK